MSCVTSEQLAKEAYIAYVKNFGYGPKTPNHFIHFCKSHKPPFRGVNYRTAKQIIAQPPSQTSIETNHKPEQAQNPYLDTSLLQNINQNISKFTNINAIYELYQQKNNACPNNAMDLLSFCETNQFKITYSECSRFLSTKPKINEGPRTRALSMISSLQNDNSSSQSRTRAKSVGKLNANSILQRMSKQLLIPQKNIENSKQIQTINAAMKIEQMIKETEEKNEMQIKQLKYENQNIQRLNPSPIMAQMESTDHSQMDSKQNNSEEIKTSVLRSPFLTQNAFTNNIINCEQSNGAELSDRFVHVNIDCTDEEQVKEAVNIATKRAFQSRLAAPIDGITKGKVFGELTMLLPSGLTSKHQFNGECAYRASAEFKQSDISQETFKSDMYYDQTSFNPLSKSDKNSETSFVENDTNISYTIQANDSYNVLSKETAIKLQEQHLCKMKESNKVQKVYQSDTIPTSKIFKISTTAPKESCRAHFTGALVGGTFVHNTVSVAYKIDDYSEYVGQGEYPQNTKAFPKAVANTFDGIAIDRNTRVIIYEKENFEGNILLDAKGPKIINNGKWKNYPTLSHCGTDIFPDPELQNNFPIEVRMWTESDMHQWSYGSVKILSNSF